ncbi:hypothetical protein JAAARDRAFT_114005, partial [Jaapia argillacea MUCL 33604]
TLAIASVASLAAAIPTGLQSRGGDCNTGPIQCCQSVQSAQSDAVTTLLGLLGVVLGNTDVLVGLTCSPISVVGVGSGTSCSASPVCCSDNSYGSLISIGCVPVTL